MDSRLNLYVRAWTIVLASLITVALGAWTIPDRSSTTSGESMSIDINVPLNEIQDGQFCQAYALVYNATPPYTFTWGHDGGQFDNSNGQWGPLGQDQIVNGYINQFLGKWVSLIVQDSSFPPQVDTVTVGLDIDANYDYNGSCEA